jgi:hypothetical protein
MRIVFALTLASALAFAPQPQAPSAIALTGVTVIDGTGAPPAPGMTILIRGDRIEAVFADGAQPLPAGADVRDLGGRFLIPGLIDAHIHLAQMGPPPAREAELRRMLHAGIVAAREMAGNPDISRDVRTRARAGDLASPDIYSSIMVAGPGFMDADPRVRQPGGSGTSGQAETDADIAPVVSRAVQAGAAAVKFYAQLPVPLMRGLAGAARAEGLKVWSHPSIYPARPLDVVNTGVDGISHACGLAWQDPDLDPSAFTSVSLRNRPRFDPALVTPDGPEMAALFREMVRRGVVFDPTLAVHARPNDDDVGCVTPLMVALTRAAHEAGVTLLAGTDFVAGAESEYPALHQEIEILVSSGILTPLEAITAATRNPARALGVDATEGTIAAGKSASLVVLEADPAADITALRSVVTVFKRGREYPRGGAAGAR